MTYNINEWLECPSCGFEFSDGDIERGDRIACPKCEAESDKKLDSLGIGASPEEIMDSTGLSEERTEKLFSRTRSDFSADDAEEVTENGIEFIEPEEHYIAGGEVFKCKDCGLDCRMSCSRGHDDVAYCENCQIEYRRQREPLVDKISDGTSVKVLRKDREQYEEYDCTFCDSSHPYTEPVGEFESSDPRVHSLEEVYITCPCGSSVNFDSAETDEYYKCSCGREYGLNVR